MINFELERKAFTNDIIFIGVDEVGRGSWAGPLVATACWINFKQYKALHKEINDSKKLTRNKRQEIILSLDNSTKFCGATSSVKEIDVYGLTFANILAMKRCIFSLIKILNKYFVDKRFKFGIYIDGKYKPDFEEFDKLYKINKLKLAPLNIIPIIRGDKISKTIALASIIAKETRDTIMRQYSLKYPNYLFHKHFGYGTVQHVEMISKYGILDLHRKSFRPISTIYSKSI